MKLLVRVVTGNSRKIHLVVDACGNPICFEITGRQVHDLQMANTLIKQTSRKTLQRSLLIKVMIAKTLEYIMENNAKASITVKSNSKSNNDDMD